MKLSVLLSANSYLTRNARQRSRRRNTCINCWGTRDLLLSFSTEDLSMDGCTKTSILDAITRGQRSPCLKLKMETVSAATQKFSGHLKINALRIVMLFCSTYLLVVTFLLRIKNTRYSVLVSGDLNLVIVSYMQMLNLLMTMEIVYHYQIKMVIGYRLKMERTSLLKKREIYSQLLN
jgi:hypothetical protein